MQPLYFSIFNSTKIVLQLSFSWAVKNKAEKEKKKEKEKEKESQNVQNIHNFRDQVCDVIDHYFLSQHTLSHHFHPSLTP